MPTQQRQTPPAALQQGNSSGNGKMRGPRSVRLSDLAHDNSQGHLFLPITIPFKQHSKQEHQGQVQQGEPGRETPLRIFEKHQHQQDDVLEIDTAASTPNHLSSCTSAKLQQRPRQETLQQSAPTINSHDIPAASLLQDQFVARDSEHFFEEDGRPYAQRCSYSIHKVIHRGICGYVDRQPNRRIGGSSAAASLG